MNTARTAFSFILGALALTSAAAAPASDASTIDRIKSNYRTILVEPAGATDSLSMALRSIRPETEMSDQVVIELHQRYPFDMKKIEGYLAKLTPEGSWSDINYKDTKRSGWEPKQHADRLLEMAKLYRTPGTPEYATPRMRELIHRALGYWFTAKPNCLNWWQNEIGIPKTLGAVCILMEDELTPAEKEGIVNVMNAAVIKMTGQNKVWLAGNVMLRGLLQNNLPLVKTARDTIVSEIVLGRVEGIKPDWSFHQHGPQQQFGNYGLAYLSSMGFYNRVFDGTPCALSDRQRSILHSFINEGYRWVVWNRHMDVSSLGRQFFHNAQLHKGYALAFTAADFGLGGFPQKANPLIGHKHFDDSDFSVHRSKDWMATVKMSSTRVIGTEQVNEDNLQGYYLGDGATYYYMRGDEYLDVFPFWDWRKVPGVTAYEDPANLPGFKSKRPRNASPLVGGLGDGTNGMSAMTVDRDRMKARKAWVFTPDFVLCLGAGIEADSTLRVTTSIDQRTRRGALSALQGGKWTEISGKADFSAANLKLHHDSTGYIILTPGLKLHAEAGKRTGSWSSFMKMYRPEQLEGEVCALHLDHGVQPQGGGYVYAVLPAASRDDVKRFDLNRHVRVVRNDDSAQVVETLTGNKGYWAVCYDTAPLTVKGKTFIPAAPGVYFLTPSRKGLEAKLSSPFRLEKKDWR